jgi:hypothetical protein
MSRLLDAIETGAMADGLTAPMLNLGINGQNGYAPDLTSYVNNAAYVRGQTIALLMEAPLAFQYLPDPDGATRTLKNLIETYPKSITGLNRGLTAEFSETAVSGGGEMQQDMINIRRERTIPVFGYVEKYGRPIQTFLEMLMLMLGMDPDTKVPGITTLTGEIPTDLLPDMISSTVLFIEPDPLNRYVMKAWLTTNMQPKSTGEIIAARDLTQDKEILDFTVEWTGISWSSLGVRQFAQSILDQISLTNADPFLSPAFIDGVQADVAAQVDVGYQANAEALGNTAVMSRG